MYCSKWDLILKGRSACQTLAKALNISSVTAGVFPGLLIELSWNQKRIHVKGHTSQGSQQTFFAHVFQALLTTKGRITGHWILVTDFSPRFFIGTADETLQQSGKQVFFSPSLKTSASLYES